MRRHVRSILMIVVLGASALLLFVFMRIVKDRAGTRYPNIIIITIDALRPDHLSCYGYQRKTSPHIDNLASDGVRFTDAVSAAGWTGEATPSLLTGTYPPFHQVRTWNNVRNPLAKTLAQRLRPLGYDCSFFSDNVSLGPVDTKTGFQRVHIYADTKDHEVTRRIINDLLTAEKKNPFLIYVHYMATHAPYRPPAPYNTMYLYDKYRKKPNHRPISKRTGSDDEYKGIGCIPSLNAENGITDTEYYIAQYDGAISYADAQVGEWVSSLKSLHLYDNTFIIVTADHGEMLGEHNVYFTHSDDYEGGYKENINVPLIVKFPSGYMKGRVFKKLVSSIDIVPTIMATLGLQTDAYVQGENLLPFIKNPKDFSREYVLSFYEEDAMWVVLTSKKWKIVRNNQFHSWQLYDLEADPHEEVNAKDLYPDVFNSLKAKLEDILKGVTFANVPVKGDDLTQEQKERLRSLGYLPTIDNSYLEKSRPGKQRSNDS